MKGTAAALVALLVATPVLACGEETSCELSDHVVLYEGKTFCFNKQRSKLTKDGVTIIKYDDKFFGVVKDGKKEVFHSSYAIARCLDAPSYLKVIPTN